MKNTLSIGSIGVTLDDLPGLWKITHIGNSLLILTAIDGLSWKSVATDNFWVLL
jgi:hypothetical protein